MDENKTESEKTEPKKTKQKKRKSKVIRKLLIGATLSTALVSLFATAEGLELYVFKGNLLFAFVISAAIQGTLYTLSISGPALIKTQKIIWFAKLVAFFIWLALLFTSSIFSFVYISKTAYPDSVMRSDAEQNMTLFLQRESYSLLQQVKEKENDMLKEIQSYISVLNGSEEGFKVADDDVAQFQQYINDLEVYDTNHPNNTDFSNSAIRSMLKTIMSGNYSGNDMKSCSQSISELLKALSTIIDETNKNKIALSDEIKIDKKRLKTWSYHDEKYEATFNTNRENEKELKSVKKLYNDYCNYKDLIQRISDFLSTQFEGGTESQIHKRTINLASQMNQEKIDTEKILEVASKIYDELIDNNTSASDERIKQYSSFKQNVRTYRDCVDARQSLKDEIDILGTYSYQSITGTTNHTDVSVQVQDESVDERADESVDEDNIDEWDTFWSLRLSKLLKEIQDLPDGITDKTRLINEVMERRRLYLVQLNDFDRALSLLKQSFHGFHEHGTMVMVSLVFAFGLDLFSFATGLFLNFFKSKSVLTKQSGDEPVGHQPQ